MGLWGSFEKRIKRRYHGDIRYQGDITEEFKKKTRGSRKMMILRIPHSLHGEIRDICKKNNLTLNDGTILLYKWLSEQRLEFEVVKRVRQRR